MVKCSFSGKEIPKGRGIMYVRKDGQILWFMNKKCECNYLNLHRRPIDYKWSTAYVKGSSSSKEEVKEE